MREIPQLFFSGIYAITSDLLDLYSVLSSEVLTVSLITFNVIMAIAIYNFKTR